jgi:hypothetical protein
LRFVAIYGVGLLYPGLETDNKFLSEKYRAYRVKYKFKVIEGTSDVVSPGKPPLQIVAYDYAKRYNTLLIKYLNERPTKKQIT